MVILPVETAWDVISSFFIFLLGFILLLQVATKYKIKKKVSLIIYIWHSFFSLSYMYYSLINVADSTLYYQHGLEGNFDIALGTSVVTFFSYVLSKLSISYAGQFLVFNILGSIGLIFFYNSLCYATRLGSKRLRYLVLVIVFLPSVSFWSSAIGKDAISFLAINLALWAALNLGERKSLMVISVILLLLVRPHMAGMITISLALSMLIESKNLRSKKKLLISFIIFPVVIVLAPFAGKYAGIDDITNITEVSSYIEVRQKMNVVGGGALDITSMPLPVKIFTFLFRPLPYDAHSIMSLFSSIENIILLVFFIYTLRFIRVKQNTVSNHTFLWVYVCIATFFLSSVTANLGIAVRQKWMILPMLVYLLFLGIATYRLKKNEFLK